MGRDLPAGTVTFLFTDVEGSTRLLGELGAEAYATALTAHRRLLREAFRRHGGVEVDTQGDSFFVAFPTVSGALAAAAEAQARLADGPIRVRAGIHTGTPHVGNEGYFGTDVHLGARIAAIAHGGQVLVSAASAALANDADLRDLGEHRLKDLSAPQRIYQLGDREFPPLRTLHQTNLPIQPSPLIGRRRELEEARALLQRHRLVTLTGPGGSGKTRLALQIAAESVDAFPDGVFWVPLQALTDPALVDRAIAASIGADGALAGYVSNRRLLLLLDNFEQVIEAAGVVASLLSDTPNAKVLVTSREPLLVKSERQYPIEPLPGDDAVALFILRARSIFPDFQPTEALARICERVDGLPLAIELAAARVAVLDPDEILARLDRRLPLLASRSRDAPARQRTLRATIEWSYDLLAPDEQELFRRLAVFTGRFSVDAAQAVCDADLNGIESLVVKNLIRRWQTGRLGMLDTIHEYALERLDASPASESLHRRHAEYFLALGRSANLFWGKLAAGVPQRLDIAVAEQDNVRGALSWTLNSGQIALGLELATAFESFWVANDPREGVRWFDALFDSSIADSVAPSVRAYALLAYGSSKDITGETLVAEQLWTESLALFTELGDEHGQAVLLHRLGICAMRRGDLDHARQSVERSEEIHRRTGDRTGEMQTVGTLGAIARDEGDEALGYDLVRQSAEIAREVGNPWWESGMMAELAALSLEAGRISQCEAEARQALKSAAEMRDYGGRVFGVGLLAVVAAEREQLDRAGRLWGAVEGEAVGAPLGGWRRHRASCADRVERFNRNPRFEAGLRAGRQLTLDEAVAQALNEEKAHIGKRSPE